VQENVKIRADTGKPQTYYTFQVFWIKRQLSYEVARSKCTGCKPRFYYLIR